MTNLDLQSLCQVPQFLGDPPFCSPRLTAPRATTGSPPVWLDKPMPFSVSPQSGTVFVDQNSFRVPKYPLLPLLKAVDHLQPKFKWASIDIITDRDNLRKLMRWVCGSTKADFRINIQRVGKGTVLLESWQSENTVSLNPITCKTYGPNFEHASTKSVNGCEKSRGHHRIIHYVNCHHIIHDWDSVLTHDSGFRSAESDDTI